MYKVKTFTVLLIMFSLSACQPGKDLRVDAAHYIDYLFENVNNSSEVEGSILIYDLDKDTYYSNDYKWAKTSKIPASTFKIPHSLIALELGIIKDENTLLKWNGEERAYDIWQQDLTFKKAFHYSCVPCYQAIAREVGDDRMNDFVKKFKYGTMDIHAKNRDDFWLVGKSQISQFEQINFLKKLYLSQLPLSKRTVQIFKNMFITKQTQHYTLSAKTGLSNNKGRYNGWYVGYIEKKANVYFFATNISPKDKYHKSFNSRRKDITIRAFKQIGFIK